MDSSFNIDGAIEIPQYVNEFDLNEQCDSINNKIKFCICNINAIGPQQPNIDIKNKENKTFINLNKLTNKEKHISNEINKTKWIPQRKIRWKIKVPVSINNNKLIWIEMMADTGANKACANLYWVYKHFKDFICIDNDPQELTIPNP